MSEYDYLRDGYKVGEYGYLTVGVGGTVTARDDGWVEIEGTRLPLKFGTPGVQHLSMLPSTDEGDERDDREDADDSYDRAMAVEDAIVALDRLTGADPERDHGIADDLLLSLVPQSVRDAHGRLTDRARWWGAA